MSDWKTRAAALNPPVPDEILEQVTPALQGLEAAFRALEGRIPPDELAWGGPEE